MLVQVYPGRARLCVRTSRLIQRSLLEPQLCDSHTSRDHQETIDRHIAAKNGRLRQTLAPREPELTPWPEAAPRTFAAAGMAGTAAPPASAAAGGLTPGIRRPYARCQLHRFDDGADSHSFPFWGLTPTIHLYMHFPPPRRHAVVDFTSS